MDRLEEAVVSEARDQLVQDLHLLNLSRTARAVGGNPNAMNRLGEFEEDLLKIIATHARDYAQKASQFVNEHNLR